MIQKDIRQVLATRIVLHIDPGIICQLCHRRRNGQGKAENAHRCRRRCCWRGTFGRVDLQKCRRGDYWWSPGRTGWRFDRQRYGSQAQDRATTAQEYDYSPSQGMVIRIEKAETEPASVRPGEQVNLIAHYALLTPNPDQPVTLPTSARARTYRVAVTVEADGKRSNTETSFTVR